MVIRLNRGRLATAILALALAFRLVLAAAHAPGGRIAAGVSGRAVLGSGAAGAPVTQAAGANRGEAGAKVGAAVSRTGPGPANDGGVALPSASARPSGSADVARRASETPADVATAGPARLPATDAAVAALLGQGVPDPPATSAAPTAPEPPPPPDLGRNIRGAAARTGLPADLIAAVIMAESAGDPAAVSPAGAQGLMQLEPPTASWLGVSDAFDPTQNVNAGADYLAKLLRRYMAQHAACGARVVPSDSGTGPCPSPLIEALAAYNAGPEAVATYGGVPPYPETQRYIAQVLANFAAYSAP